MVNSVAQTVHQELLRSSFRILFFLQRESIRRSGGDLPHFFFGVWCLVLAFFFFRTSTLQGNWWKRGARLFFFSSFGSGILQEGEPSSIYLKGFPTTFVGAQQRVFTKTMTILFFSG
ncbi:membrane-associated protein, putative [Bodo saltans]|uniref:Membrane-associated protein, putative n=1 Tax=Bodo saltans TaxID=75058 RepID=A0A0S4JVI6_BODSA|nr:membrane-associated protein, putative [Bodo saltans]|eukprot:CUG93139.1 membrane-associated protein, putative [Bodo saltans]